MLASTYVWSTTNGMVMWIRRWETCVRAVLYNTHSGLCSFWLICRGQIETCLCCSFFTWGYFNPLWRCGQSGQWWPAGWVGLITINSAFTTFVFSVWRYKLSPRGVFKLSRFFGPVMGTTSNYSYSSCKYGGCIVQFPRYFVEIPLWFLQQCVQIWVCGILVADIDVAIAVNFLTWPVIPGQGELGDFNDWLGTIKHKYRWLGAVVIHAILKAHLI